MPPVPKPPKAKAKQSGERSNRTLVIALGAAAVVAVVLIVGSILLTRGGGSSSSATTTSGGSAAAVALVAGIPQSGTTLGRPGASVTMHIYEDVQCPYCREFTEGALPAIVKDYVRTGKVKLDWRGLAFIGADSEKALRIALAAGKQNKLWEVLGLLYAKQGTENAGWVTDQLVDEVLASVPGLDAAQVKQDAQSAAITKQIADIQAEASTAGVSGTPSFFLQQGVNKPYQIQVQFTSADGFTAALDDALKG